MTARTCPCCGQEMPRNGLVVSLDTNTVVVRGLHARLTPRLTEILAILAERMPAPVMHDTLISRLWGINESEHSADTLKVQVCLLRQALAPLGLRIVTYRTRGFALVDGAVVA